MAEDSCGFITPYIDSEACIHCDLCKKSCPVYNSQSNDEELNPIALYAAKNKDTEIAKSSSSGGIFSLLAENIINGNGVVYGVRLTEDLTPETVRIDKKENLSLIRGSKYLQSKADKAYNQVKTDLISGKEVLFSGVPCQIAALKQYLGKEYTNLLCVEVICHGVPTNLAFRKYIETLERKHKSKIIAVNFRDKAKGWVDYSISFKFQNGKKKTERAKYNLYSQAYVNNLFIRKSCTNCKFKAFKSGADITLGDMWGIDSMIPGYDHASGVSLISVNTTAGQRFFNEIKGSITDCTEVTYADVKRYNPSLIRSSRPHPASHNVLQSLSDQNITKLIKESLNLTLKTTTSRRFQEAKHKLIAQLVVIKHHILR